MSALDTQHGGGHYKNKAIQPVEYIMANQMGYCEGRAVELLAEYRVDGCRDTALQARDCLQTIMDSGDYMRTFYTSHERKRRNKVYSPMDADKYIEANGIERMEAGVLRHLWWWNLHGRKSDLDSAIKWMDDLLEAAGG